MNYFISRPRRSRGSECDPKQPFRRPGVPASAKNLTPEQWAELQKQVEKMSEESGE